MSIADEISKLEALRKSGVLSEDEFRQQRDHLLHPRQRQSPSQKSKAEEEKRARKFISLSRWLAFGGLIVAVAGVGVGISSGSAMAIKGSLSVGLTMAVCGAVLGQIGRAMQSRII